MILGIQDFYYYVQEMSRALRFYRDVLGLRTTEEGEHWSSLEVNGVRLGLHWTGGEPVPGVPRDAHGAKTGGTVTFRVDDIEAEYTRLRAEGVTFLGEPSHNPWGSLVSLEDPDGNVIKLMQPPKP